MDVYNQVIKIKPDLAISYFNLANVQKKLNNVEDAVTNYQKALQFNPILLMHYNLANTFANIGQLKKADQSYDKALKINPKNPKYWSNKLLNLNYNENFSSEYILISIGCLINSFLF